MGREIGMKYTVTHTYNKNQLRPFNGDEKYDDMIKRKAAVELAKLIVSNLDIQVEEVNTSEADEAELIKVEFSVNAFSNEQLEDYRKIILDTCYTHEPIEINLN